MFNGTKGNSCHSLREKCLSFSHAGKSCPVAAALSFDALSGQSDVAFLISHQFIRASGHIFSFNVRSLSQLYLIVLIRSQLTDVGRIAGNNEIENLFSKRKLLALHPCLSNVNN